VVKIPSLSPVAFIDQAAMVFSIRLFDKSCQISQSLVRYIVSGRILRNLEGKARCIPMIECLKKESKRDSGGNGSAGN